MPETPSPDEEQAELVKDVEITSQGVYDRMIHRNPDGPDPLVQEPKGKP